MYHVDELSHCVDSEGSVRAERLDIDAAVAASAVSAFGSVLFRAPSQAFTSLIITRIM